MVFIINVILTWMYTMCSVTFSTLLLMVCWNQVTPYIGLHQLTYSQAFCGAFSAVALFKAYNTVRVNTLTRKEQNREETTFYSRR